MGEEVSKIKENHDMEKGKLEKEKHDSEKSKLEADLAEKKKQIDALNAEIANSKEEMTDVKSDINAIDSDAKLFCRDCSFLCQSMRVSCGARLDYMMHTYHNPSSTEDDWKRVIIKICPMCKENSP